MPKDNPEYQINVKPPGGNWEVLGSGSMSDVIPENISHSHGENGPEAMSFTLKRDTRLNLPDELPFTELYATLGGQPAWSGRIMRTPRRRDMESVITVVGEGWAGSHLRDYPIDKEWVITDMTRFQPSSQFDLSSALSPYTIATNMMIEIGRTINIGWPPGASLFPTTVNGVTIDLGPNARAKSIVVRARAVNTADSVIKFGIRATDGPQLLTSTGVNQFLWQSDWIQSVNSLGGDIATPRRYIHLYAVYDWGGTGGPLTKNHLGFEISNVIITSEPSHRLDFQSVLKASTVIKESLLMAPKISTDHSGITNTSFNLPAYGTSGRRSIIDVINDVNNYHQYQFFLTPDINPKPIYRPVPTEPKWIINESDAYHLDDAGANEGSEIVNVCILQFKNPGGNDLEYIATANGTVLDNLEYDRAIVLQARNPMTSAAAQQIAQAYVNAHQTSPFKGRVKITGTITKLDDGSRVPVGLITTGDGVVLASEVDPDNRNQGRIGIIQSVNYNHDTLTADIELDSSRRNINTILERLEIVSR